MPYGRGSPHFRVDRLEIAVTILAISRQALFLVSSRLLLDYGTFGNLMTCPGATGGIDAGICSHDVTPLPGVSIEPGGDTMQGVASLCT